MARIDSEWRQNRKDIGLEKMIQALPLFMRQVIDANELDSVLLQLGQQDVVQALPLQLHQLGHLLRDRRTLFGRRHTIELHVLHAGPDRPRKSSHPDHVELVKVGAEDRQEFDALEQPVPGVESLVQNSSVKLEPAQLAIDE